MIYCHDCGEFFYDSQADFRKPELEDGLSPWQNITICPYCGSEDVEEAGECVRCGNPVPPDVRVCDDCEDDLYDIVDQALTEVSFDRDKAKDILFDYMERKWF